MSVRLYKCRLETETWEFQWKTHSARVSARLKKDLRGDRPKSMGKYLDENVDKKRFRVEASSVGGNLQRSNLFVRHTLINQWEIAWD